MIDRAAVERAWEAASARLLEERVAGGHWVGELSTSALSTATTVFAIATIARPEKVGLSPIVRDTMVSRGLAWLAEHQNADGGWGDTVLSLSNISTTTLCWAALGVRSGAFRSVVDRAEGWLSRAAGGLEPRRIADAIIARYGKDRTFSVPILTMAALSGRLGKLPEAWRFIPQLPFELAAVPHELFAVLRLPVVSYALPALISMGQARHVGMPSRNPIARLLRDQLGDRTYEVLRGIQPKGGGFLEATPLTSFVVMTLVAAGRGESEVVKEGVKFLVASARADGSWPIDTNLATWVTTLSVNALAQHPARFQEVLPKDDRGRIATWLLRQQYAVEHPYTHAAPGGWAWTDLPGGVPDADDTPGALIALKNLGADEHAEAAVRGVQWLLDLQNSDGGLPTFCRGWTNLPFDRSGADLTAHAMLAWNAWRPVADQRQGTRIDRAVLNAVRYLRANMSAGGAWRPLWFGNQHAPGEENPTYGTARVLIALASMKEAAREMIDAGRAWLVDSQNADGGWGGDRGVNSSIEETALAVQGLALVGNAEDAVDAGVRWLLDATEGGQHTPATPIGFYFAKLWYFERLYPLIFLVGALGAVGARMRASQL